jgi:hypothetical protein
MGRRRHDGKPPGPSTDRQGATDHNLTTGSGNGARHRSRRPSWALWERRVSVRHSPGRPADDCVTRGWDRFANLSFRELI